MATDDLMDRLTAERDAARQDAAQQRAVNKQWGIVLSTLIDGLAERQIPVKLGANYTTTALAEIDRLTRELREAETELEHAEQDHGKDMESWRRDHERLQRLREDVQIFADALDRTVADRPKVFGDVYDCYGMVAEKLRALLDGADTRDERVCTVPGHVPSCTGQYHTPADRREAAADPHVPGVQETSEAQEPRTWSLTEEPDPEVIAVTDKDGHRWNVLATTSGWTPDPTNPAHNRVSWVTWGQLLTEYGPVTDATPAGHNDRSQP